MTVVYDALGTPIVKGDLSSKNVKNPSSQLTAKSSASGDDQGYVSWFDIWAESDTATGQKAADGAASLEINLKVRAAVCNEERNYDSTKVRILDRGLYVNGRILDMSKEYFSKIQKLSQGVFYGAVYWPR